MCNSPEIVGDVSVLHPETCGFPTDHYIVEFDVKLKFKRAKLIKRRVFDYGKGNFDELRNFLTRYPINVTPTDSINDDWEQWKDTFLTTVRRYIPIRTVKDKNSPPWIDKEVRQLIRKKYKVLKQYRRNKSADRKRKLRSVTQQIKYLIRSKHRGYLAKIESSFCDNPKLFWSYHKSIIHHRTGQSNEITYNGFTAKTAKEKADLFNTYFSSVFHPSSTTCNQTPRTESKENISEITIDVDEVAQFLRALDTSKACGPDGIPARLLQVCALEIAPSIYDTKLYKSITSVGDCESLQQALTDLDCWSRDNNLNFNESKCKVLTITRKKTR
ncbi:Hypothetical predicted protein [Paramuricea clavata]|uniref:Uncharacterized protein n=1 Tax=Paramuricea clavata TaxID=317549 RepID=A0A7D9JSP5_PARCT|nr:Hypothetical predicted protein [Paramuricea clavata]